MHSIYVIPSSVPRLFITYMYIFLYYAYRIAVFECSHHLIGHYLDFCLNLRGNVSGLKSYIIRVTMEHNHKKDNYIDKIYH